MDELIQYIRFNVYADRLPERLHPEYASFIDSLQILESQEVPAVVTNLVVLPRRDWRERWGSARYAISTALDVRDLIKNGYAPLEILTHRCPVCGVGELHGFRCWHKKDI